MAWFRIWVAFVLICIWSGSPIGWAQQEQKQGPKLVIKEKVYDAGKVNEGNDLEHTFILSNGGDEVLKIERVAPG